MKMRCLKKEKIDIDVLDNKVFSDMYDRWVVERSLPFQKDRIFPFRI